MPKFDLSPKKEKPKAEDLSLLLGMDVVTSSITQIPIGNLMPYPNQPFKPYRPEKLKELADDIRTNGVINPIIVRPVEIGMYEILAGHNRWNAAKQAELTTIPAIIKNGIDDDTAALIMVNTNLNQREELLPSEKAWAYKIQLEAMKRQAGRPKNNSCQVGTNLTGTRSDDLLASNSSDSARQIQRYIRLTFLIPELLEMVDSGELAFIPAVSLSYLNEKQQNIVLEATANIDNKVSLHQAKNLRELGRTPDMFTLSNVYNILEPQKAYNAQNDFISRSREFIPKKATSDDIDKVLQIISEFFKSKEVI